jgi:hypothetical protein
MMGWFRSRSHILLPCLLLLAYAVPLVGTLLPNLADELTESYEPAKTLRFIYTHGTEFHKWGPLPSILYAPFYAPFVGYWYLKHEFVRPSGAFLSAFKHPFWQLGTLILIARCIGLAVVLLAVAFYSRAIARATQSRTAALGAMVLCVATAPDLIFSSVITKPDGLMMAFLALSMAVYSQIITEGFTLRRGVWLSLTAVASISCKEQTAPAYVAIYVWILLSRLPAQRRFLMDYGATLLTGVGAYLVVDVVYAPAAWWQHIQYWLHGPGKDPAVWATATYTWSEYLKDVVSGILFNLGPGGSLALIAALAGSLFYRSKTIVSAWVPVVGYLGLLIAMAGYMPRYFLLPLTVLAALPVGLLLARAEQALASQPQLRAGATASLILVIVLNLWGANMAWAQVRQTTPWMVEHYAPNIAKNKSVSLAYPWKVAAGSSRLSFLGYRVDDRPLGALMEHPSDLPDVILISREWENWMLDFKNRPARNKLYETGGYSYAAFQGVGSLGYGLVKVVHPQMPFFLGTSFVPWPSYRIPESRDLLVYERRRTSVGSDTGSQQTRR